MSKNEDITPHENYTALRDWTSDMKEALTNEQGLTRPDGSIVKPGEGVDRNNPPRPPNIGGGTTNPTRIPVPGSGKRPTGLKPFDPSGAVGNAGVKASDAALGSVGKQVNEKQVFYTDDKDRVRRFDDAE